ncbi:GPN-loop GTPase 3 [Tanacetum coccineum]
MEDDYVVFDCPGQIELFFHVPALKNFVEHSQRKNFTVCVVYVLDSQVITNATKFISGCSACLSAMVQLELPHVNILSKMDRPEILLSELNQHMGPPFQKLNKALNEVVDQHRYPISLVPLSSVGSRESEMSETPPNQESRKQNLKLNK